MEAFNKRLYPFIILVAVAIGIFWGLHSRRTAPPPPQPKTPISEQPNQPPEFIPPQPQSRTNLAAAPVSVPPAQPSPSPTSAAATPDVKHPALPYAIGSADAAPQMDPMTLLGNVRHVINNYGSMFGGNPVGTNPEITAALNGDNPRGVKFIDQELGMRVNGQGEMVDSWGTPLFFHQISGTEMEIRSAGPDRKMYTADDLVTR